MEPRSYDDLYQENLLLRQKAEAVQEENRTVWNLLFETNRRLQLSSAAIKASVSSLLNYDIFWDGTNQHEFLETINSSIDQVGRLINLMTLIFRIKAGTLELNRSYQALTEVFSVVQEQLAQRIDNLVLEVAFPPDGKMVLVNFDYLVVATEFLIETACQFGARAFKIEAAEQPQAWVVEIRGMPDATIQRIQKLLKDQETIASPDDVLGPEYQLRLWLAVHLLFQQDIRLEIGDPGTQSGILRILIPALPGK